MSIQAPDDTTRVLQTLIENSEAVLGDAPIHRRLLLRGAIIDAKDLLNELNGKPTTDTAETAREAIREEMRKVRSE